MSKDDKRLCEVLNISLRELATIKRDFEREEATRHARKLLEVTA